MTEKSFENWDCVEVRERYHQAKEKKEAAKALEAASEEERRKKGVQE